LRLLILYTELAGYVLVNIEALIRQHANAEILLVHYPVNPEAPFQIQSLDKVKSMIYDVGNETTIREEINAFNPELIFCSGWTNQFYLSVVKSFKQSKRIIGFDNHWRGTIKQYALTLTAKWHLLKWFQYAWVPGQPQLNYALKMGFKPENCFTGLYPGDVALFSAIAKERFEQQHKPFPKVIISVARYIKEKDLATLWKAFITANEQTGNLWTLKCYGLGPLYDERMQHPSIQHLGFVQPQQMRNAISDAGVYVLPSKFEPWGVAVHEMAMSGLPLLLSDQVGARTMFLSPQNGFEFEAQNSKALESVLVHIMQMDDAALWSMSKASHEIGMILKNEDWCNTLIKIAKS
jgi:glycosyltransferase involved in cell wall biosynthesis